MMHVKTQHSAWHHSSAHSGDMCWDPYEASLGGCELGAAGQHVSHTSLQRPMPMWGNSLLKGEERHSKCYCLSTWFQLYLKLDNLRLFSFKPQNSIFCLSQFKLSFCFWLLKILSNIEMQSLFSCWLLSPACSQMQLSSCNDLKMISEKLSSDQRLWGQGYIVTFGGLRHFCLCVFLLPQNC